MDVVDVLRLVSIVLVLVVIVLFVRLGGFCMMGCVRIVVILYRFVMIVCMGRGR